jgi:short-subunit dehydrogenase
MWISAEEVARVAVEAMERGRLVAIPGKVNRVASVFAQVAPRSLLLPVLARNHPGLR